MYYYCIEKSGIQKKRCANNNGTHFENFWGCLQVFVLWGLAVKEKIGTSKTKISEGTDRNEPMPPL